MELEQADSISPRSPITVLIADDHRLVRAGLKAILAGEADLVVVCEAENGLQAVDGVRRHHPDVVLMDIRMPALDGFQATRTILAQSQSQVLILTTFDTDEYVYQALRAGASGFLLKDAPAEQLTAAIRCVAAGDALIDPTVTRRMISRFVRSLEPPRELEPRLSRLTPRERSVLALIGMGRSNREIATELVIEETTVKKHVGRVLGKLELRDRVQAVILAYESGLVEPRVDLASVEEA